MSTAGKLIIHLHHVPQTFAKIVKCIAHRRGRAARAIFWGVMDGYRGVTGKWRLHDREVAVRQSAEVLALDER